MKNTNKKLLLNEIKQKSILFLVFAVVIWDSNFFNEKIAASDGQVVTVTAVETKAHSDIDCAYIENFLTVEDDISLTPSVKIYVRNATPSTQTPNSLSKEFYNLNEAYNADANNTDVYDTALNIIRTEDNEMVHLEDIEKSDIAPLEEINHIEKSINLINNFNDINNVNDINEYEVNNTNNNVNNVNIDEVSSSNIKYDLISTNVSMEETKTYINIAIDTANRYEIPYEVVCGLIENESRWDPNALGKSDDRGLAQIIPRWHQDKFDMLGLTSWYSPEDNIELCCYILSVYISENNGDIYNALQQYNTGNPESRNGYADRVLNFSLNYK